MDPTAAISVLDKYGIFAIFGILFVSLLVYVLKNNEKREMALQMVITQFTATLPKLLEGMQRLEEQQSEHCKFVATSMVEIKSALK